MHFTIAFFQQLGNIISRNDAPNMSFEGYLIELTRSLVILIDKLSQPRDLFGSRFFIIAKMSASLMSRNERDFSGEVGFFREV